MGRKPAPATIDTFVVVSAAVAAYFVFAGIVIQGDIAWPRRRFAA